MVERWSGARPGRADELFLDADADADRRPYDPRRKAAFKRNRVVPIEALAVHGLLRTGARFNACRWRVSRYRRC